jgi:hypothetical protein
MNYINNQYLQLDLPLEEIQKIKVITNEKNKLIDDLDINDEPNIIIACDKNNNRINYNNIFSSVRILITDYNILKGKIEEIPDKAINPS